VSARARAACATPRALPLTKNTQLHTSDLLQPSQMPPKLPARGLADELSIAVSAADARSPSLALASASKRMRLLSPIPPSRSGLPGSIPDIPVLEMQAAAGEEVDLCSSPEAGAQAKQAALPSASELQCIIAEQAITIAKQQSALTSCQEALIAMQDELRSKVQAANDLVAEVREASVAGAGAVEELLPSVEAFYTRPKDACSKCGSTDAHAFSVRDGFTLKKPVCTRGCGNERSHQPEPTPFFMNLQGKDAKKATFVFVYCRCSTLFVPPTNLRQRQVVLFNFVEQYFRHSYAVDNSPVFPGAGDVVVVPNFYVKLGPANTRLVDWEQERGAEASERDAARLGPVQFLSPRQMITDIHTVLSFLPGSKAVIVTNSAVDFGDCVNHFQDFLLGFSQDERQRLYLLTRCAGAFSTCATYSTEDLLAAIIGQHQFVNVPFHPTFFFHQMWLGMIITLRANFEAGRGNYRRRNSVVELDYAGYLVPPASFVRSLVRM
jgi:hypothetical protein